MKTSAENLSAQQSLDIITGMIQQAKGNVRKNCFYFLLWGWVVVLADVGMYVLAKLEYPYPFAVWAISIPAWLLTLYKGYKDGREGKTSGHFDRISGTLWICFGVCIFTLVFFGFKINYQLNPVILIVCALPTFVSGVVIKFKPLMAGAVCLWIGGVIGGVPGGR